MTKINKFFSNLDIFIDPLEIDESQYHSGITFKVFSKNLKELFSGGNYKVFNEKCIGFSGFVENLVKESNIKSDSDLKLFVPIDSEINKKLIKNKGFIIVRAIKKLTNNQIKANARLNCCDYYLLDDKIIKLD